jgi:hypothetical protein
LYERRKEKRERKTKNVLGLATGPLVIEFVIATNHSLWL